MNREVLAPRITRVYETRKLTKPAPPVDEVRKSVQRGVETIVKPFLERVRKQQFVPNGDKIIIR